jgi:hypothetical protein
MDVLIQQISQEISQYVLIRIHNKHIQINTHLSPADIDAPIQRDTPKKEMCFAERTATPRPTAIASILRNVDHLKTSNFNHMLKPKTYMSIDAFTVVYKDTGIKTREALDRDTSNAVNMPIGITSHK